MASTEFNYSPRNASASPPKSNGPAIINREPQGHRLGYSVGTPYSTTSFGHGGYGGSLDFANVEGRLALGFTRNRFVCDTSSQMIVETVQKYFRGPTPEIGQIQVFATARGYD